MENWKKKNELYKELNVYPPYLNNDSSIETSSRRQQK